MRSFFLLSITVYLIIWPNRHDNCVISDFNSFPMDSVKYVVYKIDSINSYYLIYARQKGNVYKIVVEKLSLQGRKKIEIGGAYDFQLVSLLNVNGKSIIPLNESLEISGWKIDQNTTISFEGDSIRDLFYAKNIHGFCIVKTARQ